jgi:hypothetical protein
MDVPKTHLSHFVKQDLELLWVVDNYILLGFKFNEGCSEPYIVRSRSVHRKEEAPERSYCAQQYH